MSGDSVIYRNIYSRVNQQLEGGYRISGVICPPPYLHPHFIFNVHRSKPRHPNNDHTMKSLSSRCVQHHLTFLDSFTLTHVASDIDNAQTYNFKGFYKRVRYVNTEFISHKFEAFTNRLVQNNVCTFGIFNIETVRSGKKSFSWSGKIVVCIINILTCKMIIGLI